MRVPHFTGIVLMACALGAGAAHAEIKAANVDYQSDTLMEGYLAFDDATTGKRPGILVVHTKRGIGEFIEGETRKLAALGYVAFAADVYGKGNRPEGDDESTVESKKLKDDRPLLRKRMMTAYELLLKDPHVDPKRIAVIGYCMGGMAALELARAGAPVLATAVFHGTLTTPTPQDAKNIKGRVLVMHGANDQSAPFSEVEGLIKEMRDAKVKFDLDLYGGVVHGFTEPKNGSLSDNPKKRTAYNERAAKQSWAAMRDLFDEVFKE